MAPGDDGSAERKKRNPLRSLSRKRWIWVLLGMVSFLSVCWSNPRVLLGSNPPMGTPSIKMACASCNTGKGICDRRPHCTPPHFIEQENRSKGLISGLNLLHTPELILNCRTITAQPALPQVTILLSPWHHKAKAIFVAASCGWSTRAVRHSPSSISASSNVCSKLTKTRFLAVISLRCIFPKACWAAVFNSWSVEEGRSVRSSACPFGKATFILSMERRGWDVLQSWWLFRTSAMNLHFALWAQQILAHTFVKLCRPNMGSLMTARVGKAI